MEVLKKRIGALVGWMGFATLLLGPTAAILNQSIGLLAVSSSIWLFILTTNYGFWDKFSILPWEVAKLRKLVSVVSSD